MVNDADKGFVDKSRRVERNLVDVVDDNVISFTTELRAVTVTNNEIEKVSPPCLMT